MDLDMFRYFAGWNDTQAQQISMGIIFFLLPIIIILFIIGFALHKRNIKWIATILLLVYLFNFMVIAPPLFK